MQPRGGGQRVDAGAPLRRVLAEKPAEKLYVLFHGQGGIQIGTKPLGHVGDAGADPFAVPPVGHVAAEGRDRARLDDAHPGKERQQAGFAHAVGADQADHAPGWDIEAYVVERDRLAVAQAHAFQPRRRGGIAAGVARLSGPVHSSPPTAREAGHSALGSSFSQATPGRPVLTY